MSLQFLRIARLRDCNIRLHAFSERRLLPAAPEYEGVLCAGGIQVVTHHLAAIVDPEGPR